jgi:hypothetical protein
MIALLELAGAASIVIVLAVGGAVARLLRLVRDLGEPDEPESGSDDDGGNVRPTPPTPPHCGDGEPPWWPEFQRDFADYVKGVSVRARG